jgi:SAM-dependent MidA family methyltransferase
VKRSSVKTDFSLIRFDQFMAEALYGPAGYYTRPKPILGPRGDFTTTPRLTTALAERLAKWIRERWHHLGSPLPVIELGPGDGTLARDIRRTLGFFARRQLKYHFVEISPHLAERQKHLNPGGHWHATLREALQHTGGRALIISNEFFDAFPVRIFDADLRELYLTPEKEEVWQPCRALPDSLLLKNLPLRFEVAESIQQWFRSDLAHLKHGEILSIDYGGDVKENYHRRPLGTLRAYLHHLRLTPPEAYHHPGRQDLTFDVHFPDLVEWGRQIGLEPLSLSTQADFLKTDDHHGAGGAFKVLHQARLAAH